MRAINPSSIRPLDYYIISGLKDKLRLDSDSDFCFNPKIYDRFFSKSVEESIISIDRLEKYHQEEKARRWRYKRL